MNPTVTRKIAIIKSLFISKITHVLLAFSDPDHEDFKTLEKMFQNFLWQGKPP